jgi:hypothetical protein
MPEEECRFAMLDSQQRLPNGQRGVRERDRAKEEYDGEGEVEERGGREREAGALHTHV